jgi:penicillin-binding protein 2
MVARLSLEDGQWKLQWDESLILPELAGGMRLAMDYQIPARGDIYDANGECYRQPGQVQLPWVSSPVR